MITPQARTLFLAGPLSTTVRGLQTKIATGIDIALLCHYSEGLNPCFATNAGSALGTRKTQEHRHETLSFIRTSQ